MEKHKKVGADATAELEQPDTEAHDDYASLLSWAASGAARALIDRIVAAVTAWESTRARRRNARGPATAPRFRNTVERLVGDVLRARADPESTGSIFRAMRSNDFTGDVISYKNFKAAVEALVALGLLEHTPGQTRYVQAGRLKATLDGKAARFGSTTLLRAWATEAGVDLDHIDQHFRLEPPRRPLVLRASSVRVGHQKLTGPRVEFERTEHTDRLEADVVALNTFLSGFTIEGGIHYGYFRLFNEGDDPVTYGWNRGGRLYSLTSGSYQQLPDTERARMRINDEPVVEMDVKASTLTIFLGLLKVPFNASADLYAVSGLPRDVAKAWWTISLGAGRPRDDWSVDYRHHEAEFPAALVRDKMMSAYPVMSALGDDGVTWGDLMFVESEAVVTTMSRLMEAGVPALSVHDSLIVRRSDVREAAGILHDEYWNRIGASPWISTESQLQGAVEGIFQALITERRFRPSR